MDWFLGGSKTEDGDASDKLIKQGDAEREAGDLTAALHYYGNAVAVAGSPKKRKSALLAQARAYTLNGDLAEAEEAATRALDLGVCAPSLVRRGCARRKLGHFGAARLRGIRVSEFSIGFGPKLGTLPRRGGREDAPDFNLRLLPLGGTE